MFPRATFDWAVTRDQTLRLSYTRGTSRTGIKGIGGFNEIERGFTNENHFHTFRVQEAGPVGRRFFTNTRLNVGWTDTESRSALEARTIRVLDAFTSGGAQVAGGRHSKDMTLASDLDYVRGIHSVRAGIVIERAVVSLGRHVELSRHLHVRKPRRVQRRAPAKLQPADWRSEHQVFQSRVGLLRAGRHPRAGAA